MFLVSSGSKQAELKGAGALVVVRAAVLWGSASPSAPDYASPLLLMASPWEGVLEAGPASAPSLSSRSQHRPGTGEASVSAF